MQILRFFLGFITVSLRIYALVLLGGWVVRSVAERSGAAGCRRPKDGAGQRRSGAERGAEFWPLAAVGRRTGQVSGQNGAGGWSFWLWLVAKD